MKLLELGLTLGQHFVLNPAAPSIWAGAKEALLFFSQGILGDTGSGSFMLSVVRLEQRTGKAEGWKVPKVKERRSVLACPPTSQTFFLGRGDPSLSSSFFSGPLES